MTAGCQPCRSRARASAPTILASNWDPAQRFSSSTAACTGRARRYERVDVIASKASATATTRANSGICEPASPYG